MAEYVSYVQKAYDPVKYGRYSKRPYLDIGYLPLADSSLASDGKHLMSVTPKYMPYRLQKGDCNDLQETPGRLVVEILAD